MKIIAVISPAIAIFLDELPSLKLDKLPQWINEYPSNVGCFMLGIQSLLLRRGSQWKKCSRIELIAVGSDCLW